MAIQCAAIVAAGGTGSRFGARFPKQLLPLHNKPLFLWCLETFSRIERIREIVVAVPPGLESEFRRAASAMGSLRWAAGGLRRQDSVRAALEQVSQEIDVVLIHDAARPLLTAALTDRLIDAAAACGAAIPVLSVVETLKEVEADRVVRTLDRRGVYSAQTPQAFRREILERVLAAVSWDAEWTDESSMAESAGVTLAAVPGERRNIKITFAEDLEFVEHLLAGS